MNMCQGCWDKLREAIDKRGLSSLVSDSGEKAAEIIARAANGEPESIDNFDPLLNAWGSICSNGMEAIQRIGGNPMIIMAPPGAPVDELGDWPRCVICYLNWVMDKHDETCTDPNCQKPKGEAAHYTWMIDRAADDQVDVWKQMKP